MGFTPSCHGRLKNRILTPYRIKLRRTKKLCVHFVVMIVYGDPQFEIRPGDFIRNLEIQLSITSCLDLDQLRTLLIQCGQFEQAILDRLTDCSAAVVHRVQSATDLAAAAFYATLSKACPELPAAPLDERTALDRLRLELRYLADLTTATLQVKVPEGFEFYTLLPEQYCFSALQWLKDHAESKSTSAIVIGIRSIGTSLSALVSTVLEAAGLKAKRFTTRPIGHPFEREAILQSSQLADAKYALIVDEGPGISGSSMAAVVKALLAEGMTHNHISLFPGHGGEPGPSASEQARSIWSSTARYFTPLETLRWHNKSLVDLLAAKSAEICLTGIPFERVQDLSAGAWRNYAYPDSSHWPALCLPFERSKYLCPARENLSLLWKFNGLGSLMSGRKTSVDIIPDSEINPAKNLSLPQLGSLNGFVALPWIEGKRLVRADATDANLLKSIGSHIVSSAGAPLSQSESSSSISRLSDMLYWNTKEAFGNNLAQQSRNLADRVTNSLPGLQYGDGHLAPHEWIRTPDGALFKSDSFGHQNDHTIVSRQSILWDVAGAMVEWNLNTQTAVPLLTAVQTGGVAIESDALHFYLVAHAAFRMGQTSTCMGICGTASEEYLRLKKDFQYYAERVETELHNQEFGMAVAAFQRMH
jgi:hypothetical protein